MQRTLIFYSLISLLFYNRNHTPVLFHVFGYQLQLGLTLVLFFLAELRENQLEAVFYGVLGTTFQDFYQLAPLFLAGVLDDMGKEE